MIRCGTVILNVVMKIYAFLKSGKLRLLLRKPQVLAFIRCGGLSDTELPSRARRYLKCKFRKSKLKEDIKEQQHSKNWASENIHKKNGHL